jgi:hypothetical protein
LRWLWLKKTDTENSWTLVPLQISPCLEPFFSMAVITEIGDGSNSLCWKDRWIFGQRVQDIVPLILSMVPNKITNKRTIQEAMENWRWIGYIQGVATIDMLNEFLQQDVQDTHIWRLSMSG